MKRKYTIWIYAVILLTLVNACKKEDQPVQPTQPIDTSPKVKIPVVSTSALSNVSPFDATCGGNVIKDGGSAVTSRGLCWSGDSFPTIADSKTIEGNGLGKFTSQVTGLHNNSLYYVRAYATNKIGTAYGNQMVLTTVDTNYLYIGQTYKGGIIFYLDGTRKHGMDVAPYDQGIFKWSAADSVCKALVWNGYDDWFLPSSNELNLMYENLYLRNIGNFKSTIYWSSSKSGSQPGTASGQLFGPSIHVMNYPDQDTYSVRAVRRF